jgi:outer membrane receptor protein involved in Fe transport
MIRKLIIVVTFLIAITPAIAHATVFGSLRGIVHDPHHRPVSGAMIMLRSTSSDWEKTTNTDQNGEFRFNAFPIGDYSVVVVAPGFSQVSRNIVVQSDSEPVLHLELRVVAANENVTVSAASEATATDSPTPTTLVDRAEIARTPGAARSNSLAMITDYVPGAYITHDQLHIRGGHQTSWLIDGVPVPNTNIASNIGPQLDPKDVDYMEVDRGSYGAELGDRTYGVFNVVPRTGFERNNEAELVTSFGNFYQTNDEFNIGSHTQRFAYYASVNANRSNLGIQTPVPQVVHDAEYGYGGFGSLIFNLDPSNQLRVVTSLRKDHYQIPYDPNPNDIENAPIPANDFAAQYPSIGFRDTDRESDALVNFSWAHTFNSRLLLTVSPFYHYNRANYDSSPQDFPAISTQHRNSTYAGGQVSFNANFARNNLQAGLYAFHENDNELFGVIFNPSHQPQCVTPANPSGLCANLNPPDVERPSGSLEAFFLDDKFRLTRWLTLTAGLRPTYFSGGITENSISPRFGAALTLPHLNWTFRAFYGHYYQAPPLITASGPLLQLANANNVAFTSLRGERDEEHQFGVAIPYRGWTLDADTFRTNAANFFDHNNIGESNLFFPITIARAVITGWEATLRSPRIARRAQIHLAYSNQVANAGGAITGGLTDFSVLDFGPLDHDQRNTLNVGGEVALPSHSFVSTNVYYGSGFTNAFPGQPYPGDYLPGHTTFDLSLGKDFGERISASFNALNVANRRVELDNSVTFGGFHWNNPREIYVELRYRFHY